MFEKLIFIFNYHNNVKHPIFLSDLSSGIYWSHCTDKDTEGKFSCNSKDLHSSKTSTGHQGVFNPYTKNLPKTQFMNQLFEPNDGFIEPCYVWTSNPMDPENISVIPKESECLSQKPYLCRKPVDIEFRGKQKQGANTLCQMTSVSGDISCDFESPHWHRGHCSWAYDDFNSSSVLSWEYDPPSNDTMSRRKNGNHYAKMSGIGFVTITSSLETNCSRIQKGAKIGFIYKMSENARITVHKQSLLKQGSHEMGATNTGLFDERLGYLNHSTNDSWLPFMSEICHKDNDSSSLREWKLRVSLESMTIDGSISIDDIGPCSLFEIHDEEDGTCTSIHKDPQRKLSWKAGEKLCSQSSHKGTPYPASPFTLSHVKYIQLTHDKERNKTTKMNEGLYVWNARGDQRYLSDGSLSTVGNQTSKRDLKTITAEKLHYKKSISCTFESRFHLHLLFYLHLTVGSLIQTNSMTIKWHTTRR